MSNDWLRYTGADTVFQPARMSVDKLNELHQYAWDTFYKDCSKEMRTAKLYLNVLRESRNGDKAPALKTGRWGRSKKAQEDG